MHRWLFCSRHLHGSTNIQYIRLAHAFSGLPPELQSRGNCSLCTSNRRLSCGTQLLRRYPSTSYREPCCSVDDSMCARSKTKRPHTIPACTSSRPTTPRLNASHPNPREKHIKNKTGGVRVRTDTFRCTCVKNPNHIPNVIATNFLPSQCCGAYYLEHSIVEQVICSMGTQSVAEGRRPGQKKRGDYCCWSGRCMLKLARIESTSDRYPVTAPEIMAFLNDVGGDYSSSQNHQASCCGVCACTRKKPREPFLTNCSNTLWTPGLLYSVDFSLGFLSWNLERQRVGRKKAQRGNSRRKL